ncbi:nucleopolyhedrovirus P10 family protein [Streptomyces sedi]|uniref:nucleopolyhedrovirus P10 family protein n=1 Tax=Streptomyces sedi TaxID=555059 RepID=UPI001B87D3DA|nr:nucleopolyhedrovirus P10 family protein [Streptomyces sedi]
MGADGLLSTMRRQLGLGRLLPLRQEAEWAGWLTERAARAALTRAVAEAAPGVRLGELRLGADGDPRDPSEDAALPAPSGALPPGPLRMTAEFAAYPTVPLTGVAERVRAALVEEATERLGLSVAAVDLEVTELLSEPPEPAGPPHEPPSPPDSLRSGGPCADEVAEAVTAVDGVAGLSAVLDGWLGAVRVEDRQEPPSRLVRLQWEAEGRRPLPALAGEVARAAASAAARDGGAPGPVRVTLLVTAVD